jgi:hypothetical protein
MHSTFRRWHLLAPRTEEEKAERVVFQVNLIMTLWGLRPGRFLLHMLWRYTMRPIMGHFLEDRLKEVRAARVVQFSTLTDTEMVIGATTMLDKFLAMALIIKFSGHLSETQYNDLFKGHGPLAGFADKISAASALGLMVGDMQHDFTILRKLRNDFAHSLSAEKLNSAAYSRRCRALKMAYDLDENTMEACGTIERQKFLQSIAANMLHLSILIQRGIIERQILQKNFSEINKLTQKEMEKIRANAAGRAPAT